MTHPSYVPDQKCLSPTSTTTQIALSITIVNRMDELCRAETNG